MVNTLTLEDLKTRALEFVQMMATNNFTRAQERLDDSVKNVLSEAALIDLWRQLIAQSGNVRQLVGTRTTEMGGYRIVLVTLQFEKATIDLQTVFNEQGNIAGISFIPVKGSASTPYHPPAYVNPAAFHESEVTVGTGKWALPGTLTMPEGTGPFPGVVLVHGSGPNDRDETIGPNKVFRDLAWGLASHGVAVLRYEKRTLAHRDLFVADPSMTVTTKEEITDDALAALGLLRATPAIDPKRVFILGHSLGATLVPRIGQQDPELAGLIIMAGGAQPMEDSIIGQFTYLYSLAGTLTEQQKADLETMKVQAARVKSLKPSDDVSACDLPLRIPVAYWLDLQGYLPAEVAKTLSMPILVLQGERDYQVTAATDFELWKEGLKEKANATLKLCPGLNHLFIAGEVKSSPQEYNVEGHVDAEVIDTIARWIENI
jgi:dienelactone hydrolase